MRARDLTDEVRELTGYNDLELSYMGPEDHFPDAEAEKVEARVQKVFEEGEALLETKIASRDRQYIPLLLNAIRFESQGEPYLIGTGQDISELKKYQQDLQESLNEKEVLISEIYHRVKNNLALISSMLHLENFQAINDETHKVLQNSQLRIQSLATVHEELYKTQDFNNLPFVDIVRRIITSIQSVYAEAADTVTIELQVEDFELNINQAIPCTLIISELVGNAIKHAYPLWRGRFCICFCERRGGANYPARRR